MTVPEEVDVKAALERMKLPFTKAKFVAEPVPRLGPHATLEQKEHRDDVIRTNRERELKANAQRDISFAMESLPKQNGTMSLVEKKIQDGDDLVDRLSETDEQV